MFKPSSLFHLSMLMLFSVVAFYCQHSYAGAFMSYQTTVYNQHHMQSFYNAANNIFSQTLMDKQVNPIPPVYGYPSLY